MYSETDFTQEKVNFHAIPAAALRMIICKSPAPHFDNQEKSMKNTFLRPFTMRSNVFGVSKNQTSMKNENFHVFLRVAYKMSNQFCLYHVLSVRCGSTGYTNYSVHLFFSSLDKGMMEKKK